MSKLFIPIFLILLFVGCGEKIEVAEPTPENMPWLFPEQQIEQLGSSDFKARAVAARSLGKMGAKAKDAIPVLEKLAAEDEHPKVRELAAESVKQIQAALEEE